MAPTRGCRGRRRAPRRASGRGSESEAEVVNQAVEALCLAFRFCYGIRVGITALATIPSSTSISTPSTIVPWLASRFCYGIRVGITALATIPSITSISTPSAVPWLTFRFWLGKNTGDQDNGQQTKLHIELDCVSLCYDK